MAEGDVKGVWFELSPFVFKASAPVTAGCAPCSLRSPSQFPGTCARASRRGLRARTPAAAEKRGATSRKGAVAARSQPRCWAPFRCGSGSTVRRAPASLRPFPRRTGAHAGGGAFTRARSPTPPPLLISFVYSFFCLPPPSRSPPPPPHPGSPRYILVDDLFPAAAPNKFSVKQPPPRASTLRSGVLEPVFQRGGLWAMLVEKAFAKWAGCWQNLRGGMQNERTPIGTARAVRCLKFTVTFHANHAHNVTRSP